MKITDSRHRIIELIDMLGLSQTQFCNKCNLNKSALSNYINGERLPRQDKIAQIADAFGVSPAWLMGYDVPMRIIDTDSFHISPLEREIITTYRRSDEVTQTMVLRSLGIEKNDAQALDA